MPLLLDTARSGAAVELRGANCMTIGLVNNMPDAACEATERQFLDLIRGATSNAVVHLKLFSIADVPRADHVRQELAARYRDISELWDTRLDGLIVTGTEPRAANLKDEPYWATLSQADRLGAAKYDFDRLVVPRGACGGSSCRGHRPPPAAREKVRRLRLPNRVSSSADDRHETAALRAAFPLQRLA